MALAGIAGVSAVGTLLSRVTGMFRTLGTAWALGANGVSDAYNFANTTPNIIYDLVLGGVLSGLMIPVFVEALSTPDAEGGEEAGWHAISAVCSAIMAVLLVVTALFWLATPLIIHLYTIGSHGAQVPAERRLAVSLLYLFVPQLALYGVTAVATAILQARRRYAAPMYTPILNNIVVIGVLIAYAVLIGADTPAAVQGNHTAVLLLGLGTTGGVAAMAVALLPILKSSGARLRPVWEPFHPLCRKIVRLAGWLFGVVATNQIAYLVIILLSNHRSGDYSAYSYAFLFMILPHGVWAVSVMAPMEAEVAREWQRARPGQGARTTGRIHLGDAGHRRPGRHRHGRPRPARHPDRPPARQPRRPRRPRHVRRVDRHGARPSDVQPVPPAHAGLPGDAGHPLDVLRVRR